MNFGQFLSILRARWAVALCVLLITVGTSIGVSLLLPKQYTATGTLVVDQNRPDPVAGGQVYVGNPSAAFIATQVDVLKSDRVAQHVVRALGLANGAYDSWMKATGGVGSMEAWIAETMQRSLDVKQSRESNVISVAYKASDPTKAAATANAFVQAYLSVNLELRVDPAKQYSSFFDTRGKELRANLERAQARLTAYQREKGVIVATEGQIDVELARLNELSSQLVAVQAVAAESGNRQYQAQAGAGERLQDIINNPSLLALRSDITRAEARLQELSSRLGDNHPQVIEATATISSLRARLDAETRRVTASFGMTNTINRQREAEIKGALEAQRARFLRLRTAREEGAVLIRDVEAAQRAYDAVLTRQSQSALESQTTQSNAYVLAQATPPFIPSSPNLLRNTILSVVMGLVLAMGLVTLLEFIDRRVHTVDEVSELLGLPLLGVLPRPGGNGRFAGRPTPLVSPRAILRRLPAPHQ